MLKKLLITVGAIILLSLASVGWIVFSTQNPLVLAKARLRYIQATQNHTKLDNGPCLGKISDDWVLDISHIPRQSVDDQPANQCPQLRSGEVHHFVEMSTSGQIIVVK